MLDGGFWLLFEDGELMMLMEAWKQDAAPIMMAYDALHPDTIHSILMLYSPAQTTA